MSSASGSPTVNHSHISDDRSAYCDIFIAVTSESRLPTASIRLVWEPRVLHSIRPIPRRPLKRSKTEPTDGNLTTWVNRNRRPI